MLRGGLDRPISLYAAQPLTGAHAPGARPWLRAQRQRQRIPGKTAQVGGGGGCIKARVGIWGAAVGAGGGAGGRRGIERVGAQIGAEGGRERHAALRAVAAVRQAGCRRDACIALSHVLRFRC